MKKVTVAVPVYNAEEYIETCLNSIVEQSLNKDEYEVIVVDDASTDRTQSILEYFKMRYPSLIQTIYRSENSGGASVPRNEAIAMAQGEYIFFVDSDDYLGAEALERMYAYGHANNSDIVIGKYVGVKGRKVPEAIFAKGNLEKAEILDDSLFYALSALKMFRLEKVRALQLSFDADAIVAEDQAFTVAMYCNTEQISILADYDCYFVTKHEDGHLSENELNTDLYFRLMGDILHSIYQGSVGDTEYKHKLAGKFVTRMFRHGQSKDFFKDKHMTVGQKKEWLLAFSRFINESMPEEADQYVTATFSERLYYIRENDLYKLTIAEKLRTLTTDVKKLKKENKELKREIKKLKSEKKSQSGNKTEG